MSEVVELQTRCANRGQDAGVGDGAGGNGEFAGAEDEVGVSGRTTELLAKREM